MASPDDVRSVAVSASFRHSAGALGSRFLTALRDERRILGWRTGDPPRVLVPPHDLGLPGDWVEIGPGGSLEAYAPSDWLAALGAEAADVGCLALVRFDGADTALLTRMRPGATAGAIPPGTRIVARFAEQRSGAITDFWVEPEAGG